MNYFANPWNPQPEEIRAWAYDANAPWPHQDFDLALSWARHEKAYLDLAADVTCPKQNFFLSMLYRVVGDAIRHEYKSVPKPILLGFIERGSSYTAPGIREWQTRSMALISDPSQFDYYLWCAGGYAQKGRR